MREKVVGILGGMGPEATVDFMQRIITLTPANDDCDHIRMLVDNNPKVPSRIKAIFEGTGENPESCLVEMAKQLEKQGADLLVIPCNTAHYYFDVVASNVSIPILNMVNMTVEKIINDQPEIKKVGLLASTAVLKINLYKTALNDRNVNILYPSDDLQNSIFNSIKIIKTGQHGKTEIENIQNAADYLFEKGAQAVIVGCTELSVVSDQINFKCKMCDSSQVLAEEVVKNVKETS